MVAHHQSRKYQGSVSRRWHDIQSGNRRSIFLRRMIQIETDKSPLLKVAPTLASQITTEQSSSWEEILNEVDRLQNSTNLLMREVLGLTIWLLQATI
jgi:hypothetical protein